MSNLNSSVLEQNQMIEQDTQFIFVAWPIDEGNVFRTF